MLNRIAIVGVPAQDLVCAAHFYRDTLGLRMLPHHAGPPHFRVGDTFLAVFERGQSDAMPTPLVAFEVDDLDAAMAMLKERGVVFEGVHQEKEACWTKFSDSEGNMLELIQFVPGAI
jgi:catechol 2,3-dioxygenase-like lactoylglutathione lyase family enzyme